MSSTTQRIKCPPPTNKSDDIKQRHKHLSVKYLQSEMQWKWIKQQNSALKFYDLPINDLHFIQIGQ